MSACTAAPPVRNYLPKLIDLVFNGTINPGKVFDLVLPPGHVDSYDRVNLIPWDKLTSFFARSLALKES